MLCDDVMRYLSKQTLKIPSIIRRKYGDSDMIPHIREIGPMIVYPQKFSSISEFKEAVHESDKIEGLHEMNIYRIIRDKHFSKIYDQTKKEKTQKSITL